MEIRQLFFSAMLFISILSKNGALNQNFIIIQKRSVTLFSTLEAQKVLSLEYVSFHHDVLEKLIKSNKSADNGCFSLQALLVDSYSTQPVYLQFYVDTLSNLVHIVQWVIKIRKTPGSFPMTKKRRGTVFIQMDQEDWMNSTNGVEQKLLEAIEMELFKMFDSKIGNCLIRLDDEFYILLRSNLNNNMGEFKLDLLYEIYCIGNILTLRLIDSKNFNMMNNQKDNDISTLNNFMHEQAEQMVVRRKDLRGTELKVLAQDDDAYNGIIEIKKVNGTVTFSSGACVEILKDFQHIFNFNYIAVEGVGWDLVSFHGTNISAVVEQVAKSTDIQFGLSLLLFYQERALFIDFLPTVVFSTSYAFFHQPDVTENNMFLMPFSRNVWIFKLFMLIIVILLTSICSILNTKYLTTNSTATYSNQTRDSSEAFISIISIITLQGWSEKSATNNIERTSDDTKYLFRMIFFTMTVMSLIIYAYYTAYFMAAISIPIMPIKSIKDFKKYHYSFFTDPEVPSFAKSFAIDDAHEKEIMELSIKLFDPKGGSAIEKVFSHDSKLAFIHEVDGFVAYSGGNIQEICKINRIRQPVQGLHNAMFVQKNSMYLEIFKYGTILLLERGLNHRYWSAYNQKASVRCLDEIKPGFKNLEIHECSPILIVLLCGALLAVIVLLFEFRM